MTPKSRLAAAVALVLVLVGGALGGGYYWGQQDGLADGYRIGLRKGKAEALREGPPGTVDRDHQLAELGGVSAFAALDPADQRALLPALNQSPSPCSRQARRGISLATALLGDAEECPTAPDQIPLALAAWRTFADVDEVIAVLRVERRVRQDVAGHPVRGNPEADVAIIEYSDFQCPYCRRIVPVLEDVLEERGDVKLVFRHMPLSFHKAAFPAALAAEAAAEQGRFWEMHDKLFAEGKQLAKSDLPTGDSGPVPFEDLAQELGLDIERFRADFRSDAVIERVEADMAEARRLGVKGTPTLFVGDRRVTEARRPAVIGRLIDKARAEQQGRFSWDLPEAPAGAQEP